MTIFSPPVYYGREKSDKVIDKIAKGEDCQPGDNGEIPCLSQPAADKAKIPAKAAAKDESLPETGKAKAIFATMATVAVVGAAIGFGAPLIAAIMAANHFSDSVIGYNATMGGAATVIAAVATPRLAVYFGVVPLVLSMLVVGALSFLGFYCFDNAVAWFALRFSLHFAMTIMFILSEFWVNSSAPAAQRAFILSIYAASMGLGVTLGPILFSFVGSRGFLPFAIGCILIALAAVPVIMARRLAPQFKESKHPPFLHHIFAWPESTLAAFVFGAVQVGAVSLIMPFGMNAGYTETQAGQFLTLLALGNVLLLVPISIISDRSRKGKLIAWLCAVSGFIGAAIVPFIIEKGLWLRLDLFLLGGVSAGIYTLGLARLGAYLKGPELAAANSAFIFCYGMGILSGPALTGFAMDYYPVTGFSGTMAVFFGLYVVFMLCLYLKRAFRP